MSWSSDDIPDQTGRIAIVTGANGGLGLETARELARRGASVVMAVRDMEKGERAHASIMGEIPDAVLELRRLDLASLDSVRSFAQGVTADHPTLSLLINNAGIMAVPHGYTADGFELQFGTNHLGHFALTALVLPALLRDAGARVVSVTSTARHFRFPLDRADVNLEARYDPWRAYGRSKMADMDFALELDRRLKSAGSTVAGLAVHPGFTSSDLQARSARVRPGWSQRFFARTVRWVGMTPAHGALPTLRAATDPEAAGGELYTPRWVNWGPPVRRPITGWINRPADREKLWQVSTVLTGIDFDVSGMVAAGS
jgi:NAD(P)-dependent dehydrogenase (short-subunit alcohol dehydrogenase family)